MSSTDFAVRMQFGLQRVLAIGLVEQPAVAGTAYAACAIRHPDDDDHLLAFAVVHSAAECCDGERFVDVLRRNIGRDEAALVTARYCSALNVVPLDRDLNLPLAQVVGNATGFLQILMASSPPPPVKRTLH